MTAVAILAHPSTFSVFRNRSFTLMWIGQLVSSAGSALTSLAASILVYRATGSAISVGLMLMATALPTLFVGLIAGVFVDRYDRRRIMMTADLTRMVLVCLLPLLIPFNIAFLYILVALSSAVGQFFDPAYASVLPEVATDEELAAANSMMAISSIGAQAIGFAGAGMLASLFTLNVAFYVDGLTFLISALCIFLIRVAPVKANDATNIPTIVRNLRAGGRTIAHTAGLRSLFLAYLPVFITYGLNNALMLPFALRALHATEFEYSLIEGLAMVGFVVGSLVMARLGDRLREGQWISISFIGMAFLSMLYSQLASVPAAIIVYAICAIMNAPSVVGRQVLIQRSTPRDMRGRVFSAFFVMRDTMFLIGMAMVALADVMDVRLLFFLQSLTFLVVGSLALVLPGLGQPAAEWRRAVAMLRGAGTAARLRVVRPAVAADMDLLATHLPAFGQLSEAMRAALLARAELSQAAAGAAILRRGEQSDAAYFILEGRAVAGIEQGEKDYRVLEVLNAGDFFGEIAALTGVPRTANVIAEQATTLLQVPAATLREMMADPALSRLFMLKMNERLSRMNNIDQVRFSGIDHQILLELRTPDMEPTGAISPE